MRPEATAPNTTAKVAKAATRQKVTLLDVAKAAGVSRSTVSLVLQESPLVAPATRERVLEMSRQLGYIYNRGAASLRTQRSGSVGLIITYLTNPFFAELATGIEMQLGVDGQVVILGSTSDTIAMQQRFLATMQEHRVDGVLLCPARGTSPESITHLSRQLPVVLYIRNLPQSQVDYVGADNIAGAQEGVEHLLRHGHRRIAFIGGPVESSTRRDRLQGYRNALAAIGIAYDERLCVTSQITRSEGYNAIHKLLQQPDPPTAAFCYNDVVAFGVMHGLQNSGREPGRDFAVVGFDDVPDAELWQPQLTTVRVDARRLGMTAARQLLQRIAEPDAPATQVIAPAKLIIRESCGGPIRTTTSVQ